MRLARALLLLALTAVVPVAAAEPAAVKEKVTTLLILADGFGADLMSPAATPNLEKMAASGVRARMRSVWPTISSPNHWALVTGLGAMRSGLIHNDMYDAATGAFLDPLDGGPFWGKGEPIWASVAKTGGISGIIGGWAGWKIPDPARRPTWQVNYHLTGHGRDNRAALVLALLDQPPAARPDLLTLFMADVDHDQHLHGVGSPEARAAVARIDKAVGELMQGLRERKLDRLVNVVIVADHGQVNAIEGQVIHIDDHIGLADLAVRPAGGGPVVGLWPKPGKADGMYRRLRGVPHLSVYRPGEVPPALKCCDPAAMPPLLLSTEPGWTLTTREDLNAPVSGPWLKGTHGYDPDLPALQGIFLAAGPALKRGSRLPVFDIVDVYPLLAELLKVTPQPGDGSLRPLCSALADPPVGCGSAGG